MKKELTNAKRRENSSGKRRGPRVVHSDPYRLSGNMRITAICAVEGRDA